MDGSRLRRVFQVDAFTRTPYQGNPASVVLDADGLDDQVMQAIAREFNNSETAFVLSATAADHALKVRYFTPTREVPLCGHATIAAHYVLARNRALPGRLIQESGVGQIEVAADQVDGDWRISMCQGRPEVGPLLGRDYTAALLRALGIAHTDLHAHCPVAIASTGHAKVMVGLGDRLRLQSLRPDLAALQQISDAIGIHGYFVFTLEESGGGVTSEARMFGPALGIPEDPVNGTGQGALGAYLVRYGLLHATDGTARFWGRQGAAVGRPGRLWVEVEVQDRAAVSVRVLGDAVIVFSGVLWT